MSEQFVPIRPREDKEPHSLLGCEYFNCVDEASRNDVSLFKGVLVDGHQFNVCDDGLRPLSQLEPW